ncbi:MAG TPA: ribonuclease HI family protein [Dehalococcoidia bacterium]|nr:ribonuclease HI family protein [Dehalococcoidia bacterium]
MTPPADLNDGRKADTWVVYSDGASRGNPGRSAYGAVVYDPEGRERARTSDVIGIATNNVAEYRGLIAGLEAALALGARRVEVRMDSELVVLQVIGRYRVRNPKLIPYHRRVLALRSQFDEVVFRHVPRDQNRVADSLANQALDAAP